MPPGTKEIARPLSDLKDPALFRAAGGKAQGLFGLADAGLPIPKTFVMIPGDGASPHPDTLARFGKLKAPVAVRSSARGEDGAAKSFAGQYETVLGVAGKEAFIAAVAKLKASADSNRVRAYAGEAGSMAIVVQEQVSASVAGVLFTRHPVNGREDVLVIECVAGLGERLVSGEAASETYLLRKVDGALLERTLLSPTPLLGAESLADLWRGARRMEKAAGHALDMEWALDEKNDLYWLQSRPVTSRGLPDAAELDSPVPYDGHIFTRANVGEMLPGAVTPLSLTVFAEAIDRGLVRMYRTVRALGRRDRHVRFIVNFNNHLFFDLTEMYRIIGPVVGTSKDGLDTVLVGRLLPEPAAPPKQWFPIRLLNGFRYGGYLLSHLWKIRRLERLSRRDLVPLDARDPRALYASIDRALAKVFLAYDYHYAVSSYSGSMNSALASILTANIAPGPQEQSLVAKLLTDIPGIVSADVIKGFAALAETLRDEGHAAVETVLAMEEGALDLHLRTPEAGRAGEQYRALMKAHGHRAIREAELREVDWATDPTGLLRATKAMLRNPRPVATAQAPTGEAELKAALARLSPFNLFLFRRFVSLARSGVVKREHSKSLSILVQHRVKLGYRRLAKSLTERGAIPDPDLVFFFTHAELGRFVRGEDAGLLARALARRERFPQLEGYSFPDVFKGRPEPEALGAAATGESGLMTGTPVSAGKSRGRAVIVRTAKDAERLTGGEIMVARFTDIGWTPYYGLASGLVTELGSVLSHGAVVAREYGLPLVSNVREATRLIEDGQWLEMDGAEGTVRLCERA